MAFQAMAAPTGAHLKSEANGGLSEEQVVILSGSGVCPTGLVLGRITAAGANLGKYAPYDNAATDGRQTAAGVLYAPVDATSGDVRGRAHVRLCEVYTARLAWKAGVTESDKTAAYADLATFYVITRD